MEALASFRPRMFQSRQQASQYSHNLSMKMPARQRMGRLDHVRLASDLSSSNEDLRDGNIDNPSTQRFVEMMDRSATELPDDTVLTRIVGPDAFGFTPQTATGTDSDTDPGIRGMAGKLIADRGYGLTTVGGPSTTKPQGTVQLVIAAKKGTKVIPPGSSPNDPSLFLDRDQKLRVTKVESDGAGGWVMYAITDERSGRTPEPIGGPVGEAVPASKDREARIRQSAQGLAKQEKRPDEAAELADEQERQRRFEEAQGTEQVPSPAQEAEKRRVEQLEREAGLEPRVEQVVTRALGGEPRPETGPGGAPQPQAPGAPETAAVPRRAVDLRLAVRDAGIASPAAGPNRKKFNDAYDGIISGKKDPIDAVRELDRDAADLRATGDQDADNLEQLSELIKREYGLEQPAPAKRAVPRTAAGLPKVTKSQLQELTEREKARKAGKATAPEAPSTPPPVPEAAKKAPAKKAGGLTRDQEDRVIARAREFRAGPRNSEEQRIVDTADQILAERSGAPVKKAAPAKMAAPAQLTPEEEIKGLFNGRRPTNAELREMGERNNLGFGSKEPRSEMILAILGARPSRGRQVGEVPVEPVKAPAKRVSQHTGEDLGPLIEEMRTPRGRQAEGVQRPETRTPGEVERRRREAEALQQEQAAKQAPDLDRMTKAELLAESERREVVTPKSWNKDKIKAHLRDQEVHAPVKKTPEQRRAQRRTDQALEREFQEREAAGEGVGPAAPAPAKKAAKAAVPGAAPGTAAGKITAGRLTPGMRILVDANNNGHTNRKTGSKVATVTSIDRFSHGGRTRSQTRIQINAVDEDGKPFIVGQGDAVMRTDRTGFSPSQTFMAAPEPGAAPAKKAAKAAAPKRMTIGEARRLSAMDAIRDNEVTGGESNAWKNISRNVESGDWTVARARKEAKDSARHWRESATTVRRAGTTGTPESRERAASRLDGVADQYDKLAEDLTISQSVTKTDKYMQGSAPAKKAAKAAAPAPRSGREVLAELQTSSASEFPMSRDEAKELVDSVKGRAELLEMAKELSVPGRTRLTMPELKREIVEGTIGRRLDSIATRGFRGARPSLGDVQGRPDLPVGAPDSVEVARTRQQKIDRAKGYGNLGAEIEELIHNEATGQALAARIRSRGKRDGLPEEEMELLANAAERDNFNEVRFRYGELLQREGVNLYDRPGSLTPFDRTRHQSVGGADIPEGTMVEVFRPGRESRIDDKHMILERATVEVADPEDVARDEKGKRLVPEGSTPGDRTQAPVDNEPRKRTFEEAWDAAELGGEGSPGRSMAQIRREVSSGKITPEEGIRRMEDEIAFNKEDLAEVDATLRQPDLSDKDKARLQSDAAKLQNGIEAQEKASKFMRLYFRDEKPTVKEVEVKMDAEGFRVLQEATPESLREAAKIEGLDPPKGETKDEILQDMVRQIAGRVARERGIVPKKVAKKAAKKAAPEVPKVTPERGKIDVRAIASDLDVPENVLSDAQKDFDQGKMTRADIVRDLERQAQRRRNTAAIMHGSWSDSLRDMNDPDEAGHAEADREAHEQMMRQADAMEALADRLKKTRRPAAKKAPAKKAAPEVVQAEAKVDDLEARLLNNAVAELEKAKTREQGNDALEGLTMPELRRLNDHLGLERSRSKQGLKDSILDRFALPPAAIREAIAEPPRAAPFKRTGVRAKEAGIPRPDRPFSGVNDAEGRADMMLQRGDSGTEIARMLRERAAEVSKANLDEEGRRFRTEQDKDTLRSLRKSSADYLRRLGTMFQQEEKQQKKTPAKKAAPGLPPPGEFLELARAERPFTEPSSSRTGTSPVGGTRSTTAEIPNNWGMLGTGGDVEFHDDGVIGQDLRLMGEDRLMDVDGEPLSNVVGKLATRAIRGQISQEQLLDELRRLEQRLPEGSKARRGIGNMIQSIDAPEQPMPDLPDGTPAPLRQLMQDILRIPLARDEVDRPGFHRSLEDSEFRKLIKLIADFQEGRTGGLRLINDLQSMRTSLPHESQEGRFEIDRAIRRAVEQLQAMYKEDRRSLLPPTPTRS